MDNLLGSELEELDEVHCEGEQNDCYKGHTALSLLWVRTLMTCQRCAHYKIDGHHYLVKDGDKVLISFNHWLFLTKKNLHDDRLD